MTALLVMLGGAVGAPTRYLVDLFVQERHPSFPYGTLTVNLIGSFVLGLVTGLAPSPWVAALVGTGFCGALTTFSTFGFETWRLLEKGRFAAALTNVAVSLVAGLIAFSIAAWLGAALT